MKRSEDWPKRLHDYLTAMRGLPFAWGTHDCCMHVFNAVRAIAGIDIGEPFRGRYSNVGEATRIIRRYAGGGVEELAEKLFATHGLPEISPALAQRGDIALFNDEAGRPILGILALDGVTVQSVGLKFAVGVPIRQCRRAWRV